MRKIKAKLVWDAIGLVAGVTWFICEIIKRTAG